MIEFKAANFSALRENLKGYEAQCYQISAERGATARPTDDELGDIRRILDTIKELCLTVNFEKSLEKIVQVSFRVNGMVRPNHATIIGTHLQELAFTLGKELRQHHFAYIPPDREQYFEKPALFGRDVHTKFPSARQDIKEAGNCLAADLDTAAVFHLMRVAERGMRALAKHFHVKITKQRREQKCPKCKAILTETGKPVTTPIEYAMWDEVLKELKKKISSLENSAKGSKRTGHFNFYHGLLDNLQKFKNVDRNELMHTRRAYTPDEAKVVYDSVKGFMMTLASRVTEKKG